MTKIAYLMRKTEEGYEPLGDPDSMWVTETETDDNAVEVAISMTPDGEVNYSWVTKTEAAIMEIRGQPFF